MPIKLKDIIDALPPLEVVGDLNKEIDNVVSATAQEITTRDILWVSDKNIDLLAGIPQGVVICSAAVKREHFKITCTYILVPNPRLYFLNVVRSFFWEQEPPFISKESVIDPSVRIGRSVTVRAGVVIEKNCIIGDETIIDSNTVVKKGTVIGQRVKIGANNTIGGEGFGYEKNEEGQFEFIPHIGNVVIEDYVEIGNNTTIDRGVLGSTIIRKNAKIDNLVHIAHGVEIGENSLVIANAMIAGSVSIGKNVWVAPSASVLNKLKVGDSATIGMGAVVIKDVQNQQTVVGNPAKDLALLKKPTG
jgi:UDP-3-O-[3-hydroxymyristoyl] glucosamine N-acyltransferase